MRKGSVTAIVASVVIVAALWVIFASGSPRPPRPDHRIHEAIGRALAHEALALLGASSQITVIARDTATFKQPAMDLALDSFKQAIHKAGATLGAVELIQEDPLRVAQVPAGDFFELIRKAPAGSVIVSFLGPPLLSPTQREQLKTIKPKIVAFSPGHLLDPAELRSLFEQHLLHAAVVSRAQPGGTKLDESFDSLYVSVEAENLRELGETKPGR